MAEGITIVYDGSEWVGIYKKGRLVAEEHTFGDIERILDVCGVTFIAIEVNLQGETLPSRLEDLAGKAEERRIIFGY